MTLIHRLLPVLFFAAAFSACAADPEPAPAPEYDWKSPTPPQPPPGAGIRVNSIGFSPNAAKAATVAGAIREFRIIDLASDRVVFTGVSGTAVKTAESDTGGEIVSLADFSALHAPGRYALEISGLDRSASFVIGDHVWNQAFRVVTRGMYLWRCGVAVDAKLDDGQVYHHDACHTDDAYLDKVGGPAGTIAKGTGGWHDAGDYNKYVVNAGVTVGLMFKAWEQFRPALENVRLDLPESGHGLPDLLAELKFEYDWLFTMQASDGRVYHKLSAENFNYWGPPDKDPGKRYFSPWSSAATADFAAMMALGARHFREFDPAYADRCLQAAQRAWAFLASHPEDHPADLSGFRTGTYHCADRTHRLWAAVELWETTGKETYLREFETRAAGFSFDTVGPTWGDARDLALGSYLLSQREGRDPKLMARLKSDLLAKADAIVVQAAHNAHARPLGDAAGTFYWGCNGSVAGQTYLLQAAHFLVPNPAYRATALEALGYLFGRNYHGRSYVSGLGFQPPAHAHDRRGTPQLPGYLVGGPWPTARNWYDQWKDPSRNEIAINWNGSLIYALAGFVER
jgi:endoglucanase